ncbi:FAM73B isoform X1 [Brachionus plicatilis]|uniref:FAM73B isoform X1 n=1 Tax=Brachionus plicatilis TaxID=10195 RepID=A0A3M7S2M1_BRAPC|nr:FAM73B isoform X1 [Brachionus plicatilis]
MIIVLSPKKTILITSIGICLVGSFFAALKLYYRVANRKIKEKINRSSSGKLVDNFRRSTRLSETSRNDQNAKNTPLQAQELLELGLNYLDQAIKSWETALDHIESAEYMKSNTLALPNDEHADLVYKLRNLLESANNLTVDCGKKLVKPSQTLQIIQSRLAIKQQLYSEALLKTDPARSYSDRQIKRENSDFVNSPAGSYSRRYGYLSDDDNESFVSADSDVEWLTAEMLENIENKDEKNVLYEMAMSSVVLGKVKYRVSRTELLNCRSEDDFAAKLHVIRLGFDRLLQERSKKQWFTEQGKLMLGVLFQKADRDSTKLFEAYDEMINFVSIENNWRNIKDELATRDVKIMNFYDIALDFILLDAFEDLESPPSAITSVIQNRWLSQSFKKTTLATAVWSVLKAKRRLLKYPDGFISRFYSINEYLVPVLAWGFLGSEEELNRSCTNLKEMIVEYLKCLFDPNRTRYTNLDDLSCDIEMHSRYYLQLLIENI